MQQAIFWLEHFYLSLALFFLLYSWIASDPKGILDFVIKLKSKFRQHVIKRHGRILAKRVADDFRKYAIKKGWDKKETDTIIKSKWDEMAKNLGEASANRHLGYPDSTEEMF